MGAMQSLVNKLLFTFDFPNQFVIDVIIKLSQYDVLDFKLTSTEQTLWLLMPDCDKNNYWGSPVNFSLLQPDDPRHMVWIYMRHHLHPAHAVSIDLIFTQTIIRTHRFRYREIFPTKEKALESLLNDHNFRELAICLSQGLNHFWNDLREQMVSSLRPINAKLANRGLVDTFIEFVFGPCKVEFTLKDTWFEHISNFASA